ncbi:MAG: LysR family transcriptional regulator [Cellvibrionaceae bacterium]
MNNTKQLSRLMTFTVVAQKKSFTEAAKHLQISKSAVSQQVTALESELGVRLINRTTRELSLTAVGSKLLERCTVLQDQLSLIFNDLSASGLSPRGRFAVTYPHSLERTIILPAIEQLCMEFPDIEPVLIADDDTLDLVENQIDVAIHVGELPDSSYRALPIGSLTELFCATPFYVNKNGDISSTEELSQHRWISTSWQKTKVNITCKKNGTKETVTLNEYAKTNTLPAAIGMTLQHLGVALVPDVLARPLYKSGDLIQVAKQYTGPEWPVYTVHAYSKEKPIHLTRFHQIICRSFSDM